MHVRRALLLFAIVIALAALAASLSRPRDEEPSSARSTATTTTPEANSVPEAAPRDDTTAVADGDTIELSAAEDETRRLEAGRSASIEVEVAEPGQVTIPELGLTAPGDPLTPARFDVLVNTEGRYPIEFTPASDDGAQPAGTIVVTGQRG